MKKNPTLKHRWNKEDEDPGWFSRCAWTGFWIGVFGAILMFLTH